MEHIDWIHTDPDFPTVECSDERSSTPDWMSMTRRKRSDDFTCAPKPPIVLIFEDGSFEIRRRSVYRETLGLVIERYLKYLDTGEYFTFRKMRLRIRSATAEEESQMRNGGEGK